MTSAFIQRYEKARQSCVLFHLESWAVFQLTGPDTRDFLQRISTADIKQCEPGRGVQTLFLNKDGRLVADCAVLCENPDTFALLCPKSCGPALAAQLDHFLFSEKVEVREITEQHYTAMISGPSSDEFLSTIKKHFEGKNLPFHSCEITFAPSARRHIILLSENDFHNQRGFVYEALEKLNGVNGDQDLFETYRIEAGCPVYGKDTSEKTIPLEANLKAAVNFTKGCFPGQEIVARINNLGHPANVLVGLVLPETTEKLVGRELRTGGKNVGRITSVCYSPALKAPLALGYVKWNYRESGQTLDIADNDDFKALVTDLPLAKIES